MFVVNSYSLAVIFCFITMLCWGSWGNTQKLAGKTWRYELFYWDYVIGMVLFAILLGFTMGSIGTEGRPFLEDLAQAEWGGIGSVVLGGVIFTASHILLSASVSLGGLSVAFPLGGGLALGRGGIGNYVGAPKGDPVVLFLGVALIVVAIICNGIASGRMRKSGDSAAQNRKGIILAVAAGSLLLLLAVDFYFQRSHRLQSVGKVHDVTFQVHALIHYSMFQDVGHDVRQVLLCHKLLFIAQLDDAFRNFAHGLLVQIQPQVFQVLADIRLTAILAQCIFPFTSKA